MAVLVGSFDILEDDSVEQDRRRMARFRHDRRLHGCPLQSLSLELIKCRDLDEVHEVVDFLYDHVGGGAPIYFEQLRTGLGSLPLTPPIILTPIHWAKFVREPGLCLPATAVKTPGTQPTAAGHASAGEATSAPAPQVVSQTPADVNSESAAAASTNSAEWAAALSKDALSTALATPFSALDAKQLFTGDFAGHFFRAQAAGGGKLDEAVRKAFVKFDKDGSGEMDSQEFQAAIFSLGLELKAEEVQALFHAADSDSSGAIDVNEFAALVTRLLQAQELPPASEAGADAEIAEAFRKFDEDDSG